MKHLTWVVGCCLAGLAGLAACGTRAAPQAAPSNSVLRLVQTIPLPSVEGRLDHMALDAPRRRLFIAALGNNTLEVVDLRAGKVLRSVGGLHEPQGVALASDTNRLFVASGESGDCDIFDAATLDHVARVAVGSDADNVRYDPAARRIAVGYGEGAVAFLDAATGRDSGEVKLSGHPESFQMEKSGSRTFVNVPDAGQVAVLDREKHTVLAAWPTGKVRANFPMALDEPGHRLFVGCRDPARMLVFDTGSGRVVADFAIGGDTDDVFWDATHRRLYVSCGRGTLNVFASQDPNHFTPLAAIPTPPGARTCWFSPELQRLYLAVPHRGAQRAEVRVYDTSGP